MPITAQLADGTQLEFPDGTSDAVIERTVKSMLGGAAGKPAAPSSTAERIGTGMADPIHGGAQLLTKILPQGLVDAGNRLNNRIADATGLVARIPEGGVDQMVKEREQAYQASRSAAGSDGFDFARLAGNALSPVNIGAGYTATLANSLPRSIAANALAGGATGALAPATSEDFAAEKANQVKYGAAGGALAPLVAGGVARVVSPNASTNPAVAMLRSEGVRPTVGQAAGGFANRMEEKAASLPIVGDMISNARRKAVESFNTAAINRATSKIGTKVSGTGQAAVAEAGDAIGQAYDDALGSVSHVAFDQQFAQELGSLKNLAKGMVPEMRKKFEAELKSVVGSRMSPANAMLPETFKKVDSEIGRSAAKFSSSSVASEQELGDALKQLQNLLRQQASRSDPAFAENLAAADEAWANLVRIEGAAKAAKNTEGVFTPAQLNTAIQTADKSVRKRAVARGEALMQDLGNAGQTVLGNRIPNSGTADRLLMGVGAVGAGAYNPLIPAALIGGGAMYSQPMQRALVNALASRPESAQAVANLLRKSSPALSPTLGLAFAQNGK